MKRRSFLKSSVALSGVAALPAIAATHEQKDPETCQELFKMANDLFGVAAHYQVSAWAEIDGKRCVHQSRVIGGKEESSLCDYVYRLMVGEYMEGRRRIIWRVVPIFNGEKIRMRYSFIDGPDGGIKI